MTADARFLITGDLHGYGLQMLTMAAEIAERGGRFDGILCVGDAVVIESQDGLDRAQRKFAFTGSAGHPPDPTIASWPECFGRANDDATRLYGRIDGSGHAVPIYLADGNHDDHQFLQRLAKSNQHGSTYPVDVLKRWQIFRRGAAIEVGGIRIAGCGGIMHGGGRKGPRPRHLTEADYQALAAAGPCDILITHEAPPGLVPARVGRPVPGDPRLLDAACKITPRWWLFGHHHHRTGPAQVPGLPECWAVGMGCFNREWQQKRTGLLGILSFDADRIGTWQWIE